jgi:uncharacterized transporter YbjL
MKKAFGKIKMFSKSDDGKCAIGLSLCLLISGKLPAISDDLSIVGIILITVVFTVGLWPR